MQDDKIDETRKIREEACARLDAREAVLLKELEELRATRRKLGDEHVPKTRAIPPIIDIEEFLKERGEPTLQGEIVTTVGDRRKARYPHMQRVYFNVWKSLRTNDRLGTRVFAVKKMEDGKIVRTEMEVLPEQPRRNGKTPNIPDPYLLPANLFWFKPRL